MVSRRLRPSKSSRRWTRLPSSFRNYSRHHSRPWSLGNRNSRHQHHGIIAAHFHHSFQRNFRQRRFHNDFRGQRFRRAFRNSANSRRWHKHQRNKHHCHQPPSNDGHNSSKRHGCSRPAPNFYRPTRPRANSIQSNKRHHFQRHRPGSNAYIHFAEPHPLRQCVISVNCHRHKFLLHRRPFRNANSIRRHTAHAHL